MRKNNSLELIEQELNELKNENLQDMTLEEQIRWEYLTGVSLDYFSLLTHAYSEIGKAIPYIESTGQSLRISYERQNPF